MRTTPRDVPCSATDPVAPTLRTMCRSSLYGTFAARTVPLACTVPAPSSALRAWARISSGDAAASPGEALGDDGDCGDADDAEDDADADPAGVLEEPARVPPDDDPEHAASNATVSPARPTRAA